MMVQIIIHKRFLLLLKVIFMNMRKDYVLICGNLITGNKIWIHSSDLKLWNNLAGDLGQEYLES